MSGNPLTNPNWADEAFDQINGLVGKIRDNATNNAIVAVRAVVFGLMGLLLGITLIVLLLIFLTRGVQSLLDIGMGWPTAVYVSYFIVGGFFTLAGVLAMKKRS
jgi:hypothetical protein